jgi:hypothetical protein
MDYSGRRTRQNAPRCRPHLLAMRQFIRHPTDIPIEIMAHEGVAAKTLHTRNVGYWLTHRTPVGGRTTAPAVWGMSARIHSLGRHPAAYRNIDYPL